jgi:hypothetical protein
MSYLGYPILTDAYAREDPDRETAVDRVLEYWKGDDPFDYEYPAVRELQVEAFNERLRQRRSEVRVVAQKADELGIDSIESLDDAVPLLFSANVYKSYPESFISKGRWDHLLKWLGGLAVEDLADVDVSAVEDVDGFIDRVRAAGHQLVTTSGTSGKCSLFPESRLDSARFREVAAKTYGSMWRIDPARPHPLFYTGHRESAYRGRINLEGLATAFGRPETTYTLFEERLYVSEISRSAALSKALANGTATPSDIAALRRGQEVAQKRAAVAIDRFVELLAAHRDEPVYLWGQPYAFFLIMERAEELGASVTFHPDSAVIMAGGLKNNRLPYGALERMRAFYPARLTAGYGQAEVMALYYECSEGRWHTPPTVMFMLLDESCERTLNKDSGQTQGIAASFDFSATGRWGGLMSPDWVTVDFSPCPCGRRSPSLLSCERFDAAARGPDKLNCQGRIEMYIRGVLDDPPADDAAR